MKYYAVNDRKKLKEAKDKLNALDRAILTKCSRVGMNIIRVIKAGKPFINELGGKEFATTDGVLASVSKLERLGLLQRR